MLSKENLSRELISIFNTAGIAVPPENPECGYVVALKRGAHANIQLMDGEFLALSSTLKLPNNYDKKFLMELLQVNLNVDDAPAIVVSAVIDTEEWGQFAGRNQEIQRR